MKKKLFLFITISSLFVACSNNQQQNETATYTPNQYSDPYKILEAKRNYYAKLDQERLLKEQAKLEAEKEQQLALEKAKQEEELNKLRKLEAEKEQARKAAEEQAKIKAEKEQQLALEKAKQEEEIKQKKAAQLQEFYKIMEKKRQELGTN